MQMLAAVVVGLGGQERLSLRLLRLGPNIELGFSGKESVDEKGEVVLYS